MFQLSEKQNEEHELKEFEERMEKTRLTKLEAELEIKPGQLIPLRFYA